MFVSLPVYNRDLMAPRELPSHHSHSGDGKYTSLADVHRNKWPLYCEQFTWTKYSFHCLLSLSALQMIAALQIGLDNNFWQASNSVMVHWTLDKSWSRLLCAVLRLVLGLSLFPETSNFSLLFAVPGVCPSNVGGFRDRGWHCNRVYLCNLIRG